MYLVFDIETDGLLDTVSKIHVLSYQILDKNFITIDKGSLCQKDEIETFLVTCSKKFILVGHNIIRYDIPVLKKFITLDLSNTKFIDTLGLSWYLFCLEKKHGLEEWGERVKIEKVKIEDWENQSIEDYISRCEIDVEINVQIFKLFINKLNLMYEGQYQSIIQFLNFKLFCLREQEENGIYINRAICYKAINELEPLIHDKKELLKEIMPKTRILKQRPKVMFKKDGEISSHGQKWLQFLQEQDLPLDTEIVYEEPNPTSHLQLKKWLDTLGWQPITFKKSKQTGEEIPQISLPFGQGLCPSVISLYDVEPNLEELENLFRLSHRLAIFESFLEKRDSRNYVQASAMGLTNTLRFKHSKPIVNLPGVDKPYGKEIRSALTVENEDEYLVGCDIKALEDSTKQHYIYYFDPEYVKNMRIPGFDPHLDIAVLSNLMTSEESEIFKKLDSKERHEITDSETHVLHKLKKKRTTAKTSNFAMVYGAFPPTISKTAKIPLDEAQVLYDVYWERNKAIKDIEKNVVIKKFGRETWLFNPIGKFWILVKNTKDIFSSLNQSSGAIVFNIFLKQIYTHKSENDKIVLEYHDEFGMRISSEDTVRIKELLSKAIETTNEIIKLNVPIEISFKIGKNYAEVH